MSLANMKSDGLQESEDRLGGFKPFDTDVYPSKIKMAFLDKSKQGAQSVTFVFDIGGKDYEETIYVSNRDGQNFYINKEDKNKKMPLPGFSTVDDICLIATGEPLSAQDPHVEEKMVKVYDSDAKQRIPKSKPVITSLIGQEVTLAIQQILENKNKKEGDGYVATAETRTSNAISKAFDPSTKLTVVEARRGLVDGQAEFQDAWLKQNKGVVYDKRTIKDGQQAGSSGAPPKSSKPANGSAPATAPSDSAPKRSLFGKK